MPAPKQSNSKTAPATPAPAKVVEETKQTKTSKKVEATPVPAPTPVAQKGGKAAAKAVEATPAPAPVAAAKSATKATKAAPAKVEAAPVAKATPAKQAGGKKVAAKGAAKAAAAEKPAKQPKAAKKVVAEEEDGEDGEKGVRSFKVQLPGTEDFTGRFTGLTPYQAANKALSKYFRENKSAKSEITFSIRESTRGSKRSTYTYNGKREKLSTPVKYTIKGTNGENREIVKEFKNKLIKVKKSESKSASA